MFKSVALFERHRCGLTQPVQIHPNDYAYQGEFPLVTQNAFPPSSFGLPDVHVYTAGEYFCYSHTFEAGKRAFSIVIVTESKYPIVFMGFLRDISIQFTTVGEKVDAIARFNVVCSLIKSWKQDSKKIYTQFISGPRIFDIDWRLEQYSDFDPVTMFESCVDFESIWKKLLTRKTVHVVSDDPALLGPATFSLMSLTAPFPFRDRAIISLFPIDEAEVASIKATLVNPGDPIPLGAIYVKRQLKRKAATVRKTSAQIVRKKAALLSMVVSRILDRNLEIDPYSELLHGCVIPEDIKHILSENTSHAALSFEELKEFESTMTLRCWFKQNRFRKALRDAFLSTSPEMALKGKNIEQLIKTKDAIRAIKDAFPNDAHLISVCKRHRTIVKRLIALKTSDESSDSVEIPL